ncbi:unnamed protein product, partial [Ceratitis capitata]
MQLNLPKPKGEAGRLQLTREQLHRRYGYQRVVACQQCGNDMTATAAAAAAVAAAAEIRRLNAIVYQKLTTTSSISHTTRYGNKLSRTRKAGADDEDDELQSRNRHGSLGARRRLCQPNKKPDEITQHKLYSFTKDLTQFDIIEKQAWNLTEEFLASGSSVIEKYP